MWINDSDNSWESFDEFLDSFVKWDMLKISWPHESDFITFYNNNEYYIHISEWEFLCLELTWDLRDYGEFNPKFLVQRWKEFIKTEWCNGEIKALDQYDNPQVTFRRDIIDLLKKLHEKWQLSRIWDKNIDSVTTSTSDVTYGIVED